ncbi:unnamed protein product [Paramecium sonneborni]|uniref:Uncharacterized protein n=1 Tax=Paramecium sonneborni TaxID=65129 RepID=A0A8S1LBP1_9CILI|nr:unnamed protein product [Paramecium sonneborni]
MYTLPYQPTSSQLILIMNFQNPLMNLIHNLGSPILISNINFTQPIVNYEIKSEQSQIIKDASQIKQPQQYFNQIQTIQQQIEEINYDDLHFKIQKNDTFIICNFFQNKGYFKLKETKCLKFIKILDTLLQENQMTIKEQRRINQILSQKSIRTIFNQSKRKIQNQNLISRLYPNYFNNLIQQKIKKITSIFQIKQQNQNHELSIFTQIILIQIIYQLVPNLLRVSFVFLFLDNIDSILQKMIGTKKLKHQLKEHGSLFNLIENYILQKDYHSIKNIQKLKRNCQ